MWAVRPVEFEIATISHHSTTDPHKISKLQNVTNQTELILIIIHGFDKGTRLRPYGHNEGSKKPAWLSFLKQRRAWTLVIQLAIHSESMTRRLHLDLSKGGVSSKEVQVFYCHIFIEVGL
jgi:hypothetical protein